MKNAQIIMLFVAGLVMTVTGQFYWNLDSNLIPALAGAGILFSVLDDAKVFLTEFVGYVTFGQGVLTENKQYPSTDLMVSSFTSVITAIILAVTLYIL